MRVVIGRQGQRGVEIEVPDDVGYPLARARDAVPLWEWYENAVNKWQPEYAKFWPRVTRETGFVELVRDDPMTTTARKWRARYGEKSDVVVAKEIVGAVVKAVPSAALKSLGTDLDELVTVTQNFRDDSLSPERWYALRDLRDALQAFQRARRDVLRPDSELPPAHAYPEDEVPF